MLDQFGFWTLGAMFIVFVVVFAVFTRASLGARLLAAIGVLAWGTAIVALADAGLFAARATGTVPAVGYAVAAALAIGLVGWIFVPGLRAALLAVPLPVLVGVNIGRVLGGFFLLLSADGLLAAPFAPVAGWGDVAIGVLAPFVAMMAARGSSLGAVGLWNALGALDLIVALTLGLLSAPDTPFRVFTAEPSTRIMGELPWVFIPTVLVPMWLLVHLAIAAKLYAGVPRGKQATA
jgi:hypothetical protein